MQRERRIANTASIFSLWINWFIAVGALTVVPLMSLYISKAWLPAIVFAIEIILYFVVRHNSVAKAPSCLRLPHIAMVTLFWTALIMAAINLLYAQSWFHIEMLDNSINAEIPYISILIVAPIAMLVTIFNLRSGHNAAICLDCQARHGSVAERGILGKLYSQEGEFLSRMLLMLSSLLTFICWIYYFFFYINTNINAPDRFIFVWAQVIIFAFSLIYLAIRYFSLWLYYCQKIEGQSLRYNSSSLLRYIILCGDYVYLKTPNVNSDNMTSDEDKIDTPARLFKQYTKELSEYDAVQCFSGLSGIANAKLRFLYVNTNFNTECNIFHYVFFAKDKNEIENSRLEGKWYTLPQIKAMINDNLTSPVFNSELERIYTVAMSWKTYDISGRRLYDIKNYKPTFRLRDIKDWDVDFNDITWLFVSANNADRPFFHLRNFWNKYICGIGIVR